MRSILVGTLTALAALVAVALPASAGPVEGPVTAALVRKAIENGKAFLRRQQKDSVWEIKELGGHTYVGGTVSLALLSLFTCGVTADDQSAVKAGLEYLRTIRPQLTADRQIAAGDASQTYVVSLQTMVYALAGHPEDRERIQENMDWLMAARIPNSGWTYGKPDPLSSYDASNTQYALLALHEGVRSGAKVDPKILEAIQTFYLNNQNSDGSWAYGTKGIDPSMTMTTAGLCGLLITGMDLEQAHIHLNKDGSDDHCGEYKENPKVALALGWIGDRFKAELKNTKEAAKVFETTGGLNAGNHQQVFTAPFYGLYGIERTGRLTGQRFLRGHDWYRVGCQCLVNSQNPDGGSWGGGPGIDGNPIVATSFALLFLGKGRTPVLMTKLAYGPNDDEGWNNKHNDMRNLAEFAGRELFKGQPMAWQNFDVREQGADNDAKIHDLTQQLLESPIVFFNGHDLAPRDNQEQLLREYLANGGFVFAECCCGSKNHPTFDKDFRALMHRLYPDAELKPLPPTHPIFTASGKFVSTPDDFHLEGIEQGCKTLVVYSPDAIAGYWEANDATSERGRKAFAMAANVIAYATGLEPPRPKLDEVKIVDVEKSPPIKRGYVKAAQLRYEGDWRPAPRAMHNLMVEARNLGLDVILDPDEAGVHPSNENVVDYRFLYLHGRGAFSYKAPQLEHLRFDLEENGALLFADACCGNKAFDASFRTFMDELWAGRKDKPKLEPIPPDDELYSAELNGVKIETVLCRRETPDGKGVDPDYQRVRPALEGIKIDGRWVVIYSRYDIGCALERHPTPGCLGHDFASAAALGKAAVLYALKR